LVLIAYGVLFVVWTIWVCDRCLNITHTYMHTKNTHIPYENRNRGRCSHSCRQSRRKWNLSTSSYSS
jgi:hypothetical protein